MGNFPAHIAADSAVAVWRLPHTDEVQFCYTHQAQHSAWNGNDSGFVINPFHSALPQVFIRGELEHTTTQELLLSSMEVPPTATATVQLQQAEYETYVAQSVAAIKSGMMHKTVAARNISVTLTDFSALPTFVQLCEKYPAAFVSLVYHPTCGLWMGATPERLLSAKNNTLQSMALAGTRNAQQQWTDKELDEQHWVTEFIERCFISASLDPRVAPLNELHAGNNLQHLVNHIDAQLPELFSAQQLLPLLQQLHPTPAVGGLPKEAAMDWIMQHEPGERNYYSGYLGPVTSAQDFDLFVNLRCMQVSGNTAILYAGAGITALSNPTAEWLETERKMQIIKSVLQST